MPRTRFDSARFHYTFGPHPPTLRIAPGSSLRIVCPDSDNAMADGNLLPPDRRQNLPPQHQGNPVAGPIYVEGAEPGDTLLVRIDAITLDRNYGQTGLGPNHGLIPDDLLLRHENRAATVPRRLFRWNIGAETAHLANPLGALPASVPLSPFIGCIGVCPAHGEELSTLLSGACGGNFDLPLVRAGATLELPVFQAGALLAMGDIHAAQGDGEVIGGAIETSGLVDCTIDLRQRRSIEAPRLTDERHMAAVGLDHDLRQSVARAYAHLLDWLVEDYGLNRWDSYNMISQSARARIGNILAPPFPVAVCLRRSLVPFEHARRS